MPTIFPTQRRPLSPYWRDTIF